MSGIRMLGTEVAIPKIRSHNSGGRLGRITVRFSLAVIWMAILGRGLGLEAAYARKGCFCALVYNTTLQRTDPAERRPTCHGRDSLAP